jgi:hypothetical protein
MTTPLTTLTKHIFKGKSTIYNFKTFQSSGLLFKLSLQRIHLFYKNITKDWFRSCFNNNIAYCIRLCGLHRKTLNFEGGDHTASHSNEYMISYIVEMVPNSFCTIFAILNNA